MHVKIDVGKWSPNCGCHCNGSRPISGSIPFAALCIGNLSHLQRIGVWFWHSQSHILSRNEKQEGEKAQAMCNRDLAHLFSCVLVELGLLCTAPLQSSTKGKTFAAHTPAYNIGTHSFCASCFFAYGKVVAVIK